MLLPPPTFFFSDSLVPVQHLPRWILPPPPLPSRAAARWRRRSFCLKTPSCLCMAASHRASSRLQQGKVWFCSYLITLCYSASLFLSVTLQLHSLKLSLSQSLQLLQTLVLLAVAESISSVKLLPSVWRSSLKSFIHRLSFTSFFLSGCPTVTVRGVVHHGLVTCPSHRHTTSFKSMLNKPSVCLKSGWAKSCWVQLITRKTVNN